MRFIFKKVGGEYGDFHGRHPLKEAEKGREGVLVSILICLTKYRMGFFALVLVNLAADSDESVI